MIPDGIVDEVKSRADIVEIIGEFVTLKRRGSDYWAPCPFHKEKTPSFHVVPGRGFYKCFGCGAAGDVFTFLMRHEGLPFLDAVRAVARRVGVEIPEATERREEDPYRVLREAVAFAADFYQRRLWDDAAAEPARRYLQDRGISREAAEHFMLGYAPADWQALREAAARHGIGDDVLLEAGLIKVSEKSGEPYDRLRDRIVFPITDATGRVIAFGGRLLADRENAPKYLNSPETPLYHKGDHLYGLAWAKGAIRRERSALLVEGYMDYVSLAARGIENVVAGLGTALTLEQAQVLARYTKDALLLYDSDKAGLRATFRSADALLAAGVHPLVVTLPPGEDPDSLVRDGGAEALRPFLDQAVDVLDRKLAILESRGYFRTAERTRKALDGLLPTLRATSDPVLRDIYVARVVERTGVQRETIQAEIDAAPAPVQSAQPDRAAASGAATPRPRRRPATPVGVASQRKLLLLLLKDEARIAQAAEAIRPEELTDTTYRELFQELVRQGGLQGRPPTVLELGAEARERLEELLGDPEEFSDADRIFEELVVDVRSQALFERIDRLKERLASPDVAETDKLELLRALTEANQALRALGSELTRLGFKLSPRYRKYLRGS